MSECRQSGGSHGLAETKNKELSQIVTKDHRIALVFVRRSVMVSGEIPWRGPTGQIGVKVNRPIDPWRGLALAAVVLTTVGLAACGRKGNLDPPPSAALPASPQTNAPRSSLGEDNEAPVPANGERPSSRHQAAATPPPTASQQNKSFFLDFLLGK